MMMLAVGSAFILAFLAILYGNQQSSKNKANARQNKAENSVENSLAADDNTSSEVDELKDKKPTSYDLDFWDMYYEDRKKPTGDEEDLADEEPIVSDDREDGVPEDSDDILPPIRDENEGLDDGNHIKVMDDEGKETFYEIDDALKKNDYNFNTRLNVNEKGYVYSDDTYTAKIGIDLDKSQGAVDFARVKKSGVDYAMLKIGGRGYTLGEVTLDDKFVEYATSAKAADVPIGVYFSSMAINDVEAVEEANFAVGAVQNYGVTYPIAIKMDIVKNDNYRSKILSNKERTTVAKAFCDTVKAYGFTPIIMASKDYLVSKLDLSDLEDYDIWVLDETCDDIRLVSGADDSNDNENDDESDNKNSNQDIVPVGTKYPYRFTMWQYTRSGRVDGITDNVNLSLGFVDYTEN